MGLQRPKKLKEHTKKLSLLEPLHFRSEQSGTRSLTPNRLENRLLNEQMKKNKSSWTTKKTYAASSIAQPTPVTSAEQSSGDYDKVLTLPLSMLQPGSFPRILYAAGLASSKSDANRLIAKKGAYVVVPNSGLMDSPTILKWATIEQDNTANPKDFLVDWEILVLRSGKSKVQICHVVRDEQLEAEGIPQKS